MITRPNLLSLADEARLAVENIVDFATDFVEPTVRLGVTGLSRSGKTVFITSLVHNLIHGGRLPGFRAYAEGRISGARLRPQPDMAIPRFDFEDRVAAMSGPDRHWPGSTTRISELRLVIDYESTSFLSRTLSPGRLTLDIVDYPGEWLLDLPLLAKSYEDWSRETLELARKESRAPLARDWLEFIAQTSPYGVADEVTAKTGARLFTNYLRSCRDERVSLSTLPPGRFLMPGDMEGSPALTFCPLPRPEHQADNRETLWALMADRYEAYKTYVVKPFFRDHFARLDRQIVLVDTLSALNVGPTAVSDLERALTDILACFRPGSGSWLSGILSRRIDRILFAATKADHLHHADHDRLQDILARLVRRASEKAAFSGAAIDVAAIAAIRATREATVQQNGAPLNVVIGTPQNGEIVDDQTFDGNHEFAFFPGDLPSNPSLIFEENTPPDSTDEKFSGTITSDLRFAKFRPPDLGLMKQDHHGHINLPHIRLDKALEILMGDKLT